MTDGVEAPGGVWKRNVGMDNLQLKWKSALERIGWIGIDPGKRRTSFHFRGASFRGHDRCVQCLLGCVNLTLSRFGSVIRRLHMLCDQES